jgi:hypothetical protein
MADPPFVYATAAPRPVEPGGTRVRVRRRRPRGEGDDAERGAEGSLEEDAWRALLVEAVADLNAAFQRAAVPFLCVLDEDEAGYTLHVRREGAGEAPAELEEETLEPRDLPRWLARIRTGLGLLVDETA